MAQHSNIQWTDITWNPARGCIKKDEDCKYCYMYRESLDGTRYNPMAVRRTKTVFDLPLRIKQTTSNVWHGRPLVFTSSLTDIFIEHIDPYRHEIWDIIRKCPHLIFQILTKRPERIEEHLPPDWGEGWDNVWLGTSVGSQKSVQRMVYLSQVPAKIKFLSLEPLYGEIDLSAVMFKYRKNEIAIDLHVLPAFDWVIVGGESGNDNGKHRYRPCELKWIESIVNQCKEAKAPVFVKQMGTHLAKQLKMSDRHGGNIDEFPTHLQLREFPKTK